MILVAFVVLRQVKFIALVIIAIIASIIARHEGSIIIK